MMMIRATARQMAPVLLLTVLIGLGWTSAARAEDWSIVFTPQIWASHIAKNGFVAGAPNTIFFTERLAAVDRDRPAGKAEIDSSPKDALNPQFGGQIAFQYGRWTLALTGQYVHFKTENDVAVTRSGHFCFIITPQGGCETTILNAGERLFKEEVTTDRVDFDLALSYFFPDVVKDVLDVSAGLGFKFIYADSDRRIVDSGVSGPGALFCTGTNCVSPNSAERGDKVAVSSKDYLYGATFPMSFALQLTRDKRLLLPFNVNPFLGVEHRDDEGVVYEVQSATDGRPRRIDGTTFAYGVTSDLNLRYIFDNGISPYVGLRVQYIKGHETFLAWGPLAGVSFRFGGK
jgi:hypothetical protein